MIRGKLKRSREALSRLKIEDREVIPQNFRGLRDAALIYAELLDKAGFSQALGLLKSLVASSYVLMMQTAPA